MASERAAQDRMSTLTQLLGTTSLFGGLHQLHLQRLASIGTEETFSRGAMVFREGDQGDKFYLVLEGSIRISRQAPGMGEEALAILRPGSAFGEMSLIDDSPRSADAVAHESCRLFVVKKEALEDLLFVDRDLAYDVLWRLVRILSSRLRETTDKMMFLTFAGKFE